MEERGQFICAAHAIRSIMPARPCAPDNVCARTLSVNAQDPMISLWHLRASCVDHCVFAFVLVMRKVCVNLEFCRVSSNTLRTSKLCSVTLFFFRYILCTYGDIVRLHWLMSLQRLPASLYWKKRSIASVQPMELLKSFILSKVKVSPLEKRVV
jgi:hypothetical protein